MGLFVAQVGSLGNGTMLGNTTEVELVVFLSCFRSFQEEAKHHQRILNLIYEKLLYCQDLLALQLQDLRLVQGAPCEVVSFTVQTRETGEPITVTLVPAFGALGKRRGTHPTHIPALPAGPSAPSGPGHGRVQTPAFTRSAHVLRWALCPPRCLGLTNCGCPVAQLGKQRYQRIMHINICLERR